MKTTSMKAASIFCWYFSWLSPFGDFALIFRPHNNSHFFLLSIWYGKIPDRTIVWYANADQLAPGDQKV
jgi:hypothetical protein